MEVRVQGLCRHTLQWVGCPCRGTTSGLEGWGSRQGRAVWLSPSNENFLAPSAWLCKPSV